AAPREQPSTCYAIDQRRPTRRNPRGQRDLAPHLAYAVTARLFKGLTIIDRSILASRNYMSETTVALELFLRWLDETHRRTFKITEEHAFSALAVTDSHRLAIEVRSLLGPMVDSEWLAARARLEQQIAAALPPPVAVCVP